MNNSVNIEVLKFGGTSQKKSTYEMILNIINEKKDVKFIVVLSAIKGITNKLLDFTESTNFSHWNTILQINEELSKETLKYENEFITSMKSKLWNLESDKVEIVSMGEFFTTNILNDYLKLNGIKSKFISSYDVIKSNMNNNGNMYNKGEFTVDHETIFEIDNKIKNCEMILEICEKSEKILSSASYDIKNLVELIKMETN